MFAFFNYFNLVAQLFFYSDKKATYCLISVIIMPLIVENCNRKWCYTKNYHSIDM